MTALADQEIKKRKRDQNLQVQALVLVPQAQVQVQVHLQLRERNKRLNNQKYNHRKRIVVRLLTKEEVKIIGNLINPSKINKDSSLIFKKIIIISIITGKIFRKTNSIIITTITIGTIIIMTETKTIKITTITIIITITTDLKTNNRKKIFGMLRQKIIIIAKMTIINKRINQTLLLRSHRNLLAMNSSIIDL